MSTENRVELKEGKETKVKYYIVFAINAIYIIIKFKHLFDIIGLCMIFVGILITV